MEFFFWDFWYCTCLLYVHMFYILSPKNHLWKRLLPNAEVNLDVLNVMLCQFLIRGFLSKVSIQAWKKLEVPHQQTVSLALRSIRNEFTLFPLWLWPIMVLDRDNVYLNIDVPIHSGFIQDGHGCKYLFPTQLIESICSWKGQQ